MLTKCRQQIGKGKIGLTMKPGWQEPIDRQKEGWLSFLSFELLIKNFRREQEKEKQT